MAYELACDVAVLVVDFDVVLLKAAVLEKEKTRQTTLYDLPLRMVLLQLQHQH